MTEPTKPMYDDMDDIELITSYLNGQLDPERAEAVRRRLEEDEAFREFAEPLLLAWSVPTHLERHPRPEGEWERAWEEFVKRTGFPKRPPKWRKRRLWVFSLIQIAVLATLIGVYVWLEPIRAYIESRDYGPPLTNDSTWVTIGDGVRAKLTPGASLRLRPEPYLGRQWVLLSGTAHFYVEARDSADKAMPPGRFRVRTRIGHVTAREAYFTVTTDHPDTTIVTVYPFDPFGSQYGKESWVMITTQTGPYSASLDLRALQRGLMVRDSVPERIPYIP
jgi:ferric-dicitrate binding protein FerR (iron transport regulator)